MEKILSIIISSAFRDRLKFFLNDLNEVSISKKSFEVCILIDQSNKELESDILEYQKQFDFEIKYDMTPFDYGQSNDNYNHGIFSVSDPKTYFIQIVSDRYRYANKGWDLFLRNYVGFVEDDIFFLRTVAYSRHIKPRTSLYNAFCYNETWGFYTRKLMEATNGFPTVGISSHDCGFEMLYYYIKKNIPDKIIRDIPVPFLDDSRVVQSINSDKKASKFYYRQALYNLRRTDFYNKELIENLIYNAKKFSLILEKYNKNEIVKDEKKKFLIIKNNKKIIKKISYKASIFEIIKTKIEARLGNVHAGTFPVDMLVITQFKTGRRLIKSLLKRLINDKKKYSKFSKNLSRISFKIICNIFFVSSPNPRATLDLITDNDFIEGVLENKNFHQEFKNHYKILGLFIK